MKRPKRKTNKSLAGGDSMIANLNELIASRNSTNRTSTYDKLVNDEHLNETYHRKGRHKSKCSHHIEGGPNFRCDLRCEQVRFARNYPSYCEANIKYPKKLHVSMILQALLDRKQKNRGSLLLSLFKAPAVLAAIFSLVLAASLMILFTLSFHHIQNVMSLKSSQDHKIESRHLDVERTAKANCSEQHDSSQINSPVEAFVRALTVHTECAAFLGQPDGPAIAFKGIPYASPPVGERRWTRPKPIWQDRESCSPGALINLTVREPRAHCAQLSPMTHRFTGHEDCLYLDIYSPRIGDQFKKLPVMVYIHGGFNTHGSSDQGRENWIKGQVSGQLASELEVIIVAFNFRLQALGFMRLNELAQNNGPDGSDGNYGLWDQLVALKWIKRNIESFGGDPDNIVLFGPDSASSLPLALISQVTNQTPGDEQSPHLAQDLFRAAWLMNPSIYHKIPYNLANRHNRRRFLDQSTCSSVKKSHFESNSSERSLIRDQLECLMSLSAEEVVRQFLGNDQPAYRMDDQNCLPTHGIFANQFVTVDGELVLDSDQISGSMIRGHPSNAKLIKTNSSERHKTVSRHKYDLLIGSSAQAVGYWPCPRDISHWGWPELERYVNTSLNSFGEQTYAMASELYKIPSSHNISRNVSSHKNSHLEQLEINETPEKTYLTMVSDIRQICPINELAEKLSGSHQVSRYIVENHPTSEWPIESEQNSDIDHKIDRVHKQKKRMPAFHMWDLVAFFGFQFYPEFEPSNNDLKFQRLIREMVKDFAYSQGQYDYSNVEGDFKVKVIDAKAAVTNVRDYKRPQCEMWARHLSNSYAWVS